MQKIIENTVRLSVRDLVEFVCRSGDIDKRRTGPAIQEAMLVGAETHRRLQKEQGESYSPEVSLRIEVPIWGESSEGTARKDEEEAEARLIIEGRADGVIRPGTDADPPVIIDEIKGVYRDVTAMDGPEEVHLAQAEVYAYIAANSEHLSVVGVQMTYVQLEDSAAPKKTLKEETVRRFSFTYSFEEIKARFDRYVGLYQKWVLFVIRHRKSRDESAAGFPFPYDYRPGQKKIVRQVYRTIEEGKRLFVQAPTGIGKTLAMLYPSVQAVSAGFADKIFYLSAKNVTAAVAEEGMQLMQSRGLGFSYIRITAKDRICVLPERKCDPVHCPRAAGHFDRVNEAVYDLVTHEKAASREVIEAYAEKHRLCPYEFSLDVSYYADVIICDYNYAFAPHVALQRYFSGGGELPYILLADEAHNLADRGRDMYSAVLVKEEVLEAKKLFPEQKSILKLLDRTNKLLLELKRECSGVSIFGKGEFPTALVFVLASLKEAIGKYTDRHPEAPDIEEITDFYFTVSDFLDTAGYAEEEDSGYTSFSSFDEDGHFYIKLYCINPAARLKEVLEEVRSTIFFSATFLPVNYYKELLTGDIREDAMYVNSPFDSAKRRLLVGKDVSSKYTRRGPAEYRRIAEYLLRMCTARKGNYLAFFPSHQFLSMVAGTMNELLSEDGSPSVEVISQKRVMSDSERAEFLSEFSDTGRRHPLLGLSVMGGIFSEGIDLTHEQLIGVAVVGTGLPQISPQQEMIRNYYDAHGENGFDYAYRFPGFNKVMQAAGRLIRTAEDEGVILLLDERFRYRDNLALFPREWADYRVTDLSGVREEILDFWASRE